jgi:hypothetical protein
MRRRKAVRPGSWLMISARSSAEVDLRQGRKLMVVAQDVQGVQGLDLGQGGLGLEPFVTMRVRGHVRGHAADPETGQPFQGIVRFLYELEPLAQQFLCRFEGFGRKGFIGLHPGAFFSHLSFLGGYGSQPPAT